MLVNYRTLNPKPLSQTQGFMSLALSSPDFRQKVKLRSGWVSALWSSSVRGGLINDFGQELIEKYSGENLLIRQQASLHQELKVRGYIGNANNGWQALEEVSQANLQRKLGAINKPLWEMESEIVSLAQSLRFYFVHNTVHLKKIETLPILSSAELRSLGFNGGLNTEPFNSQILKSDNNVFFRVYIVGPNAKFNAPSTEYGNTGLFLDLDYAEEVGWISPFVMYREELRRLLPGVYKHNQDSSLVPYLHKMDFKIKDFRTLVAAKLIEVLTEMRRDNPEKYNKIINVLEGPSSLASMKLLKSMIIEPLGFSTGIELKIPVAVPVSKIQHMDF